LIIKAKKIIGPKFLNLPNQLAKEFIAKVSNEAIVIGQIVEKKKTQVLERKIRKKKKRNVRKSKQQIEQDRIFEKKLKRF